MVSKIGIDIGNYNIKSSEGKMFEARMTEDYSIEHGSTSIVKYMGKQYLIEHGDFNINIRKIAKEDIMLNIATILAMSTSEPMVDICVGLPVSHFASQKDELIRHIEENDNIEVEYNGVTKRVVIRDVYVLPEAVGVYYSLSPGVLQVLSNKDVLIIDVGGKTVDMCVIDKRKTIQQPVTEPLGMLDIYNEIANKINADYPEACISLEDIRTVLEEGLYLIDKPVDLSFTDEIFDAFVYKVFNRVKTNYKDYQRKVVILAGGGASLADKFKKHIPNIVVNDDIFANAKGFKKFLELQGGK